MPERNSFEPGAGAQRYSWEPEVRLPPADRDDLYAKEKANLPSDYDVQVSWVRALKPDNNPPWVLWRLQYGHGENSYDLPLCTTGDPESADIFNPQIGWVLPNRGLRLRVPGRELLFSFLTPPTQLPPLPDEPGVPGGAPCVIQISVQPCSGMFTEQLPLTDMIFGGDAPAQLPLGSTEMRFSNPNTGISYAAAAAFVQFPFHRRRVRASGR